MMKYIRFLLKLNYNTIYLNFKYFSVKEATKFPILVSSKVYLKAAAGQITIDAPIKAGMIKIGFGDVGIFDHKRSRSIWELNGSIVFKGKCSIGHGSKISVGKEGKLVLGDNFTISAESSIVAFSKIEFGSNCLLSWDVLVMDTDFHKIKDDTNAVINHPKPILIGDNVWIGCRSLILKGTEIPIGCIIGANSVVSKKLESSRSVYAGNPCKVVKENISWEA